MLDGLALRSDRSISFNGKSGEDLRQYDVGWPTANATGTGGTKTDNNQTESLGQTRKKRDSVLRPYNIGRNPQRASDLDQNFRDVNFNDFDNLKNYIEGFVAAKNASFDLGTVNGKNETLRESQQRKSLSQRKICTVSPTKKGFTEELAEMVFGRPPPEVVDDCIGSCCVNNNTMINSVKEKVLVEDNESIHISKVGGVTGFLLCKWCLWGWGDAK